MKTWNLTLPGWNFLASFFPLWSWSSHRSKLLWNGNFPKFLTFFVKLFRPASRRFQFSLRRKGNSCHFLKVSRDNFKHTTSLLLLVLFGAFLSSAWWRLGLMGFEFFFSWKNAFLIKRSDFLDACDFLIKLQIKPHGIEHQKWHHQHSVPSKKFPAKYLVAILFLTIFTPIKRIKRSGRAHQSAVWSACKFHTNVPGSQALKHVVKIGIRGKCLRTLRKRRNSVDGKIVKK